MKVNSENLYEVINELSIGEKSKFKVFYDDVYCGEIYWNGTYFEWENGKFTSEIFFNPMYDFEITEEPKKIEKIDIRTFPKHNNSLKKTAIKLNEIIDYINKENK